MYNNNYNGNDKDIKIETGEDVGLDDKIKAGARALGKKIEDPDKDTGSEYEAEKTKEAKEEGFDKIAKMFEGIAAIEKGHEERYKKLLKNIEDCQVFKKEGKTFWKCRNCGNIYEGVEAPEICPVCKHPRAYYELKDKNY